VYVGKYGVVIMFEVDVLVEDEMDGRGRRVLNDNTRALGYELRLAPCLLPEHVTLTEASALTRTQSPAKSPRRRVIASLNPPELDQRCRCLESGSLLLQPNFKQQQRQRAL
jgi:hypothetical protein